MSPKTATATGGLLIGNPSGVPLWRTFNPEEGRIEWYSQGELVGWVQADTVRSLEEVVRLERFIFWDPPQPSIDPPKIPTQRVPGGAPLV